MLKSFKVKNYLSIKEPLCISFKANAFDDSTSYENFFHFNGDRILKVSSFYGMNASGKTNIIRAFAALQEVALAFNPALGIGQKFVLPYYPFKFDEQSSRDPTELEIEFSLNNDDNSFLYRYKVVFNANFILEEKLEKQTSQKMSILYERKTDQFGISIISFGKSASNSQLLEIMKDSIVPNQTYLSLFNRIRIPDISEVYSFFQQRLVNISPEVTRFDDIEPSSTEDPQLKKFLVHLLKAADFNIDDYHVSKKRQKVLVNGLMGTLPERNALFLDHKVDSKDKSIEYLYESLGTKKMIVLGLRLYNVLKQPSVLIVDELESSLHPELTKLIVTLFLDETTNPHHSQLLFTSHETTLLNLSLLRRDQIHFVYKDETTGETYLHSLQEFKMRKTSNVMKSYLSGRFSTSPNIRKTYLGS